MEETSGTQTPGHAVEPLPARRVAVWPHTLGQFEHFNDAVAVMTSNGALAVWRWGEQNRSGSVPLKIYAPGAWVTVEHLGNGYAPAPTGRTSRPADYADRQRERVSAQRRAEAQQAEEDQAIALTRPDEQPAPRSHANDPNPFVQLSPEALNAEHSRRPRRRVAQDSPAAGATKPGEDGENEAFRRSGDALPLPEDDEEPEDTAGGVAQSVRRALGPIGRRLHASAKSLWQGFCTSGLLDWHTNPPLLQPQLRWFTSTPVLTAAVLTLLPSMLYLSFSAN